MPADALTSKRLLYKDPKIRQTKMKSGSILLISLICIFGIRCSDKPEDPQTQITRESQFIFTTEFNGLLKSGDIQYKLKNYHSALQYYVNAVDYAKSMRKKLTDSIGSNGTGINHGYDFEITLGNQVNKRALKAAGRDTCIDSVIVVLQKFDFLPNQINEESDLTRLKNDSGFITITDKARYFDDEVRYQKMNEIEVGKLSKVANYQASLINLLFFVIPALCIGLLFLKLKTSAGKVINILLIINACIYLLPATIAFLNLNPSGHGIEFLYYLIIFPLCGITLLVLGILKIVFYSNLKNSQRKV